MSDIELRDFPTYGALSRAAMVFGIPLMAIVGVLLGSLGGVMALNKFVGTWSYLFLIVSVVILLVIKGLCATDDQAMRILGFEVFWFTKKRNKFIWGDNLVLLPIKYGRQNNEIKRFYEQFIR
jgi:type IV secretion system protein VirB3